MSRILSGRTFGVRHLYDEVGFGREERRSLNLILTSNLCGNLWGQVCGGGTAAMVGLAVLFGAGDLELGLLVAITQVAALLQIPFSMLVNRTHKRKRYIVTWGTFSRTIWVLFGLMPYIFRDTTGSAPLYILIGLMAVTSVLASLVNVCWYPWFSDLAPISIRGRWLSVRDTINSATGLLFGLLAAHLLDVLPDRSKYLVVFLLAGSFGVVDMVLFGFVKDVPMATSKGSSLGSLVKVFRDKRFMLFTITWTAWCFTANMADGYLTPYAMNMMGLSYMQITLFGSVAASLSVIFFIRRWGRLLDRIGGKNVMFLGCLGASFNSIFFLFSTPGAVWPMLLRNLIGAAFWCGCNLAASNMQLSCSPDEDRSTYIAVFSCVANLAGCALGTMCGGWFLDTCTRLNWFTGSFDRYKMLILGGCVLRFLAVIIFVPRLMNDSDVALKDVFKGIFRGKDRRV